MRLVRLGLGAMAMLTAGCPSVVSEPPPPMRQPEIPVAPPHALGAHAAGTDAAPHPDTARPGGEADPDAPPPAPSSGLPDAGAPATAAPSAPDAGMAL